MVADIDILPRFNNKNGFIGNEMKIAMIAAMAKNRIIGADNDMPWHLPADLKHFKAITLGKAVIMGRKTYESIGKPLEGRANLVLTRNPDFEGEGVEHVEYIKVALKAGRMVAEITGTDEVMVIGGTQIYEAFLPEADRIYLTEVDLEVEGDAFFPDLGPEWKEVARSDVQTDEKSGVQFSFVTLEKA